jgi:threonylcarbamoyladenosine tRNA methylthiotransferase MtaB
MRKSRAAIRRATRKFPHAKILIVGCYSTYDTDRLEKLLRDANIPVTQGRVLSHYQNLEPSLVSFLRRRPSNGSLSVGGAGPDSIKHRRRQAAAHAPDRTLPALRNFPERQRAFVKVQDGCDAFCSYCIVCYTRPVVQSRPVAEILEECRGLLAAGHKELVLCGVFLGAFGRSTAIRRKWDALDTDPLAELLRAVAALPNLWRVRLSSLEPGDLGDELLRLAAETETVAPHFHLPLQSGADTVLRRMNRQYRAAEFLDAARRLHQTLDRPALTTDIIVGYPGETEEQFRQTLAVARDAAFAKIHAFPFSAIEPTAAWKHRHEAPAPDVVRARLERLATLETELAREYRRRFLGDILTGVVESTAPAHGRRIAMTDRYLSVTFPASREESLAGSIVRLRITGIDEQGLLGERIEPQ